MDNIEVFQKQKAFFRTGITLPVEERKAKLMNLKKMIKTKETKIFDALQKDLGKSHFESYATEIGQVYDEINSQLRNSKKWRSKEIRHTPLVHFPARSYLIREPYGVVLIIGPFNYPFLLNMLPLVSALAAGNCVMIKPSEYTPNTTAVIKEIISSCFPPEYVSVINPAEGKKVVQEVLTFHFDYIFFTGSVNTGKVIMKAAAVNLIPVTLELGGKSPCIVDKDSNLKLAAKRIVWGKFLNAGQTCVAPDYVWIQKDIKNVFLKLVVSEIKSQFGENIIENQDYTHIINAAHVLRLKNYLNDGELYFGGSYNKEKCFFEPTILTNAKANSPLMTEEIFGPILPVVVFDSIDEIISQLRNMPKPLALYYFSNSKEGINKVISHTSSGGVTINDTIIHAASSSLPFGGIGNSGIGAYHGTDGYDTFSHKKGVMVRSNIVELPVKFAPYTKLHFSLLRTLLK